MNRHPIGSPGRSKCVSVLTALCLLAWSAVGCVNTRVVRQASADGGSSVRLSVFLEEKDCRRGRPTVDGVVTELYYIDGGERQLLRREAAGRWLMAGLVPGEYEAQVRYRANEDGQWEDLSGDTRELFTLGPGEQAEISIVLEKTPVAVVVVAGLAAVVLAVLLIDVLEDSSVSLGDLIVPPVPEELGLLAPPPELVWIGLDAAMLAAEGDYRVPASADDASQPAPRTSLAVLDHAPRHLSTGNPLDQEVRFTLSAPIDPQSLDPGDILLVDRSGRTVTGGVYCREDARTCVFDPLRPLDRGETYTVTLREKGLRTADGRELVEGYWWYFTTGPAGELAPLP